VSEQTITSGDDCRRCGHPVEAFAGVPGLVCGRCDWHSEASAPTLRVISTWRDELGARWAMRSDGLVFVWNVEEWIVPKDDDVPYKPVPGCG
jgi:hypothetical protein